MSSLSPKANHARAAIGGAVQKYPATTIQKSPRPGWPTPSLSPSTGLISAWTRSSPPGPNLSDEQVDRIAALLRVGKRSAS